MRLDEILQLKLDLLFKAHSTVQNEHYGKEMDLAAYEAQMPILNDFLNESLIDTMSGTTINVQKADTKNVTTVLMLNGYYADTDIESSLRTIKVVLKAMNENLKVALTNSQKMTLDSYIQNARDCYGKLEKIQKKLKGEADELSEKLTALEAEINTLRGLIDRLLDKADNSILTMEDLEVVKEAIKDMPIETRHDALIKFREYNHDRYEGNPKNNGKIDVEEFKACFVEAGIEGPKLDRAIAKNEDEIRQSANIANTKKILEYFASIDLLSKFEIPVLMTICIYGNYESCKRTFEDIVESNFDINLCLPVPSVWIDNTMKKEKRAYRKRGGTAEIKETTLRTSAHGISFFEFRANRDYLTSKGLVVDSEDVGIRRTMSMPTAKLKEAVELLEQYGLLNDVNRKKFKLYLISTPNIGERLDRLVELGLLHGESDASELHDYARNFLTTIHTLDIPTYSVLYREKQTRDKASYYDTIRSNKVGRLSGQLTKEHLGNNLDTFEQLQAYNEAHFVDYSNDIQNMEEYDDIISRSTETEISEEALKHFAIVELDKYKKVNDYVYRIGNVEISRLKVLRNLGALLKAGHNEEGAFFYSIVRGSLLTPESYKEIRNYFSLKDDMVFGLTGGRQ